MKKKILAILLSFTMMNCAPAKPSWDRTAPDTLFEAVNVKDTKKVWNELLSVFISIWEH